MSGKETGLEPFVDQPISVITNDGRNIVGILKGFDQATNLILDESHERVYSTTVSHALRQLQIVLWGKFTGMKEMQRCIALVIKDLLKRLLLTASTCRTPSKCIESSSGLFWEASVRHEANVPCFQKSSFTRANLPEARCSKKCSHVCFVG